MFAVDNLDLCMPKNLSSEKIMGLAFVCYSTNDNLKIMDLGGGAAIDYFISIRLFNSRPKWICIETEAMCKVASEFKSQYQDLDFKTLYDFISQPNSIERFNLYSNSALQYVEKPLDYLSAILKLKPERIAIIRTPFVYLGHEYKGLQESIWEKNGPTIPTQFPEWDKVQNEVDIVRFLEFKDCLLQHGYRLDYVGIREGNFGIKKIRIRKKNSSIKTYDILATRVPV